MGRVHAISSFRRRGRCLVVCLPGMTHAVLSSERAPCARVLQSTPSHPASLHHLTVSPAVNWKPVDLGNQMAVVTPSRGGGMSVSGWPNWAETARKRRGWAGECVHEMNERAGSRWGAASLSVRSLRPGPIWGLKFRCGVEAHRLHASPVVRLEWRGAMPGGAARHSFHQSAQKKKKKKKKGNALVSCHRLHRPHSPGPAATASRAPRAR